MYGAEGTESGGLERERVSGDHAGRRCERGLERQDLEVSELEGSRVSDHFMRYQ